MANHIKQTNNNVTRLINLVFYLKEHKRGATAAQIREQVSGYSSTQKDETFKRQFRRDREKLSSMGFCVETRKRDGELVPVYVLNLSSTMQDNLSLSPSDVHLLRMCAKNAFETPSFLWKEDLVNALCKIQNATDTQILVGDDAEFSQTQSDHIKKYEQIIKTIETAKRNKNMLVFDYEDHNSQKLTRLVVPIKVFRYLGDMYLFAYDKARQEPRRFRFDRFLSKPIPAHADEETLKAAHNHADDEAGVFPFQIGGSCVLGKLYFSRTALNKAKQLIGSAFDAAFNDKEPLSNLQNNMPRQKQNADLNEELSVDYKNAGTCVKYGDGIIWNVRVANVERLAQWVVENGPGIYAIEPAQTTNIIKRGLEKIIGEKDSENNGTNK